MPDDTKEYKKLYAKWRNASIGYQKAVENKNEDAQTYYKQIMQDTRNKLKKTPKIPKIPQTRVKRVLTDDEKEYRSVKNALSRNRRLLKKAEEENDEAKKAKYEEYIDSNLSLLEEIEKKVPKRQRSSKPCPDGYTKVNGRCVLNDDTLKKLALRDTRLRIRLARAKYGLSRRKTAAAEYLKDLNYFKNLYKNMGGDLNEIHSPTVTRTQDIYKPMYSRKTKPRETQ